MRLRWLCASALVVGCQEPTDGGEMEADSEAADSEDAGGDDNDDDDDDDAGDDDDDDDGPVALCPPEPEICESDCPEAPTVADLPAWFPRLTESPPTSWTSDLPVEIAVGTEPGLHDVACWTEANADGFAFIDLFLDHGATYHLSVRAIDGEGRRSPATSVSWQVDAVAPAGLDAIDDTAVSVDGSLTWNDASDTESGLAGYRVAIGTEPLGTDIVDWTDVDDAFASLDIGDADVGRYYASVRSVDVAGNQSNPIASGGFLVCPDHFAFVPANEDEGIATSGFCVMRFEAGAVGYTDGTNLGDDVSLTVDPSPGRTPWTGLTRTRAGAACMQMGDGYRALSNAQWQAIARSAETVDDNWSGGSVGQGTMPRGHADGTPGGTIANDEGDPCAGTGQGACEDGSSTDFLQRRVLYLRNGDTVFDLAGNADEFVESSTPPDVLWTEYSAAVFNDGDEAEAYRSRFAPAGAFDSAHGVGMFYGGGSILARGGNAGDGGRSGVFAAMHNAWNTGASRGFRCGFSPP